MKLLNKMKEFVQKKIKKIKSSYVYRLTVQQIKLSELKKENKKIRDNFQNKEKEYIAEICIKKNELRYVDLRLARIMKYVNSYGFDKKSNEEIKDSISRFIKGEMLE